MRIEFESKRPTRPAARNTAGRARDAAASDGERGGSGTGILRSASLSGTAPPDASASLVLRSRSSSSVISRRTSSSFCQHRCRQRCVWLSRRATQSASVTSERQRLASLALAVYVPATYQSFEPRRRDLRRRQRHKIRIRFKALEFVRATETIRSQKSEFLKKTCLLTDMQAL